MAIVNLDGYESGDISGRVETGSSFSVVQTTPKTGDYCLYQSTNGPGTGDILCRAVNTDGRFGVSDLGASTLYVAFHFRFTTNLEAINGQAQRRRR